MTVYLLLNDWPTGINATGIWLCAMLVDLALLAAIVVIADHQKRRRGKP